MNFFTFIQNCKRTFVGLVINYINDFICILFMNDFFENFGVILKNLNKYYFRKFVFLFVLFLLLVFSGCSNNQYLPFLSNSNEVRGPNVDNSGSGLGVSLDLNTRWISDKIVSYDLSLKNTGVEPIILNRNNFRLSTKQVLDGSQVLFGFDKFYDDLFKNGDLKLYHDQDVPSIIKGQFEIIKPYFNDVNNNNIVLNLNVNYNYETKFSNNVVIDMSQKSLTVKDTLSQAAPVNIKKIILKPTLNSNIYEIGFYIKDIASSFGVDYNEVDFTNVNFKLGINDLNDCSLWANDGNGPKKIADTMDLNKMVLSKNKINTLIAVCKVDLSDYTNDERRSTVVSGVLDYNYKLRISKIISLPDKRNTKNTWN